MLREQADITEHELKSLEGQGLLKASRRNSYGWRLYHANDVDRIRQLAIDLREKRQVAAVSKGDEAPARLMPAFKESAIPYSLEQYRAVYVLIEKGMSFDRIPLEAEIHPSIVHVILKDYEQLSGTFVVAKSTVVAINRLALPGIETIRSGQELLGAFEALGEALDKPSPCARCDKDSKRICLSCARELYAPKKKSKPTQNGEDGSPSTPPPAPRTKNGGKRGEPNGDTLPG